MSRKSLLKVDLWIASDSLRAAPYLVVMMRPLWSRVLAAVLALWFVAMSAGPELAHACPTHGSHAVASATSHADHDATRVAGGAHHASSDTNAPTKQAQCTCLGHCCGTAPVGVLSTTTALIDSATIATRDAGLPDYAYVPVAAQHVLPLANGPPLSA